MVIALIIIAAIFSPWLVTADENPLPYFPPPSNETARSTNLMAEVFANNHDKMNSSFTRLFHRFDSDKSGVLSVTEFISAINSTSTSTSDNDNSDGEYPPELTETIHNDLLGLDTDKSGDINLSEFLDVYQQAFTLNFTIQPALCLDTAARFDLCRLDMEQNVTVADSVLTAKSIMAREQFKCETGLSGVQSQFQFQYCVLGNPCNRIISSCFTRSFGDKEHLALIASSNKRVDSSIKELTRLPFKDKMWKEFMAPGHLTFSSAVSTQSKVGLWSSILAFLGSMLYSIIIAQVTPLLKAGMSAAVARVLAAITSLSPQFFMVTGAILAIAVIGTVAVKKLIDVFASLHKGQSTVIMETWNPYEGELAPKCAWANYMTKSCVRNNVLTLQPMADSGVVCEHGGEMYRNRKCSYENMKMFYQDSCMIGCRHMCLVADFDCGTDGYTYKNATEFIQLQPTPQMNPFIFSPSFAGKQMVLMDSRYVYRMAECRDTCDRFQESLSEENVSGCQGFVVRSPDPMIDPRPAFARRQVCMLLGSTDQVRVAAAEPAEEPESKDDDDEKPKTYPVFLNSANDLFEYNVMTSNQYPPFVAAFKQ